jgi:hypothetical protein
MSEFKVVATNIKDQTTGGDIYVLVPLSVPAESMLNLSLSAKNAHQYYDYSGYVQIALAWLSNPIWGNFTTLDLSNTKMSSPSLGGPGDHREINGAKTMADVFHSDNCKLTKLNMANVQFTGDAVTGICSTLVSALSGCTTLLAGGVVDLSNTTVLLSEGNSTPFATDATRQSLDNAFHQRIHFTF